MTGVHTLLKRWKRARQNGLDEYLGGQVEGLKSIGRKRWAVFKALELCDEVFVEDDMIKAHGPEFVEVVVEDEKDEGVKEGAVVAGVVRKRVSNPLARKRQKTSTDEVAARDAGKKKNSGRGGAKRKRLNKGEEGWDSAEEEEALNREILAEQAAMERRKAGRRKRGRGEA